MAIEADVSCCVSGICRIHEAAFGAWNECGRCGFQPSFHDPIALVENSTENKARNGDLGGGCWCSHSHLLGAFSWSLALKIRARIFRHPADVVHDGYKEASFRLDLVSSSGCQVAAFVNFAYQFVHHQKGLTIRRTRLLRSRWTVCVRPRMFRAEKAGDSLHPWWLYRPFFFFGIPHISKAFPIQFGTVSGAVFRHPFLPDGFVPFYSLEVSGDHTPIIPHFVEAWMLRDRDFLEGHRKSQTSRS